MLAFPKFLYQIMVKIKQEPQVFEPVTLEVTFESKDELIMIEDMLMWDISIPELTYPEDEAAQQRLMYLMKEILAVVREAVKGSE